MAKKYKEYIHRQNDNSNHVWEKKNLITLIDKKSGYDIYYCKKCNIVCKQRTIGILEFESNSLSEIEKYNNCKKFIKIISMDDEKYDVGNKVILNIVNFNNVIESKNLVKNSEHIIVNPPDEYKEKYPNCETSVWIMGTTKPVRLLCGEFKFKN